MSQAVRVKRQQGEETDEIQAAYVRVCAGFTG